MKKPISMLDNYAKQNGFPNIRHYTDNYVKIRISGENLDKIRGFQHLSFFNLKSNFTNKMLRCLIKTIYVHDDGRIEIKWNYKEKIS